MVVVETVRGKKRERGDSCSGFCTRTGRRCNGGGDHRWELAWVSRRIGGCSFFTFKSDEEGGSVFISSKMVSF